MDMFGAYERISFCSNLNWYLAFVVMFLRSGDSVRIGESRNNNNNNQSIGIAFGFVWTSHAIFVSLLYFLAFPRCMAGEGASVHARENG